MNSTCPTLLILLGGAAELEIDNKWKVINDPLIRLQHDIRGPQISGFKFFRRHDRGVEDETTRCSENAVCVQDLVKHLWFEL